jgi:hypothetical protein|tara:strand:+ start:818 stop:955 length:138 start_codon:yes stop_codon:yes gene_type:complete
MTFSAGQNPPSILTDNEASSYGDAAVEAYFAQKTKMPYRKDQNRF